MADIDFVKELKWRGLVHSDTPGIGEYLQQHKVGGYAGFDPTADSLHIGNLVVIMMLVHFQRAGHSPIALVGGATGMIGDPSGKSSERNLLSEEVLRYNQACVAKQLAQFLDFYAPKNPAKMVNNYDWFKEIRFLDFLRDVGKYVTINYMKAKDSVKSRLEGDNGISYTEFAYQLVQGYDFLHLYEKEGCRVQMGGADQWGNITTGTHLISKKVGADAEAFAVTCPLITHEDGKKIGKSEGGTKMWLDPKRTSPFQFYQYWMQASDVDAEKFVKLFTLFSQEEVETMIAEHREAPHLRTLQKAVAKDVTERVHGKTELENAEFLTNFLFKRKKTKDDMQQLSLQQWQEVAKASSQDDLKTIRKDQLANGMNILDVLIELNIASSRGDARRAIQKDNSIKVNAEKCQDAETSLTMDDSFHGKFLQIERGKKKKYVIELV